MQGKVLAMDWKDMAPLGIALMAVERAEQYGVHDVVITATANASAVEWALAQEFFPSPNRPEETGKRRSTAPCG
jgi:hypothetical protein